MNKNRISLVALTALLLNLLLFSISPIVSFAAEDNIIRISDESGLLEFIKKCSLDSYSKGKSFVLTSDIVISGEDFAPVPTFSGEFDGAGHTISGISISGAFAPAGLFSRIEEGGLVKNLTLSASVSPDGTASLIGGIVGENYGTVENCSFIGTVVGESDVGGIAGVNRLSGSIIGCKSEGEVLGNTRSGGIAGSNYGIISSSESASKVNTLSITPSISLNNLNLSLTLDITKLPSFLTQAASDMGGIAGYSTGMILDCKNYGQVGYKHIGYNVGGIVGRSSGHLANNENLADIYGRKDVGGIVGQLEPYVSYDLSEDGLAKLKAELDKLNGLFDELASEAKDGSATLSSRIDKLITHLEDATTSLELIMGGIGEWGVEVSDEFNRASEILSVTISLLSDVTAGLPELSETLAESVGALKNAIASLDDVSEFSTIALQNMQSAMANLEKAVHILGESLTNIKNGISSLEDALAVNEGQEKAVEDALNQVLTGFTNASGALADVSSALNDMSDAIESGSPNAADIAKSISDVANAFGNMSDAFSSIADGFGTISGSVSVDFNKIKEGVNLISRGLSKMVDAISYVETSISHLSSTLKALEDLNGALGTTMDHVETSLAHLQKALLLLRSISTEADEVLTYLKGINPIQIPAPKDEIKFEADKLFASLLAMEGELKLLNKDANSMSGTLIDILTEINGVTKTISDDIVSTIYGFNNIPLSDRTVSEDEVSEITSGRVYSSHNRGRVYADNNVGGIAGIIGLEYALEPDEDFSSEITVTQTREYQLKAVLHNCINYAPVSAKRDGVGGVVGKMDFGTVFGCESYSGVNSESGGYIGGIAGISAGLVSSCFAKVSLSGGDYIGGILGSGVEKDSHGDSSLVRDCYSIIEITKNHQYAGAIAGVMAGNFERNYFVSDTLAGIDRISYSGKAEPISYDDLVKRRHVVDGFYSFTLDFVADGEVIKSVEFQYGDSFDSSIFPEIPEKAGHYAYWDKSKLVGLVFDTKVNAVYKPFITSLGSDEKSDDGRSILLVGGKFTDVDRLVVEKYAMDVYISEFEESLLFTTKIVEAWEVIIPESKSDLHNVHLLSNAKDALIYVNDGGGWVEVEASELGSYVAFNTNAESLRIAVVTKTPKYIGIALFGVGIALLLVAVVYAIAYRRKEKAILIIAEAEKQENNEQ